MCSFNKPTVYLYSNLFPSTTVLDEVSLFLIYSKPTKPTSIDSKTCVLAKRETNLYFSFRQFCFCGWRAFATFAHEAHY